MLHPPKLTCATITHADIKLPAVFHNAFRSPTGENAVILANATREIQQVTFFWKNEETKLELKPGDALLVK